MWQTNAEKNKKRHTVQEEIEQGYNVICISLNLNSFKDHDCAYKF